jgi:hypothetical protein
MPNVTKSAVTHLDGLLKDVKASPEACIRLAKKQGGLQLQLDREQPGDHTVVHNGRTILVFNDEIENFLQHRTIDLRETESGPTLVVKEAAA